MEVDNSPRSLASSLTGESTLTLPKHPSNFLVCGVFKSGWSLTLADVRAHSVRQHDPLETPVTDIIHIYVINCCQRSVCWCDLRHNGSSLSEANPPTVNNTNASVKTSRLVYRIVNATYALRVVQFSHWIFLYTTKQTSTSQTSEYLTPSERRIVRMEQLPVCDVTQHGPWHGHTHCSH